MILGAYCKNNKYTMLSKCAGISPLKNICSDINSKCAPRFALVS